MTKLRKGNKQLIKDINRSVVIEKIRKQGPISRIELSKITKLGLSTITKIIDELAENNLVFEVGEADSTGGRRPKLLEFNHDYGYTIGVKIMQDHVIIAVTNLKAKILHKIEKFFNKGEMASHIIIMIKEGIQSILSEMQLSQEKLLGIGIAVSGLVNRDDGSVIRSSLLGWENIRLIDKLMEEFRVPIYIDNDVNAYTYAEICMGYGKKHNNFICLSIGDGIGASIVIDREIYVGEFGGAGEFGHTIIQTNGYDCHCGQKGCFEVYASGKFLEIEGKRQLKLFPDSILKGKKLNFDSVYEAAKKGDQLAKNLFKRLGENLGIGLINVINSFNPSTIVLIGEGMIAKDFFLESAINKANENFFSKVNYHTEIVVSELGNDAWLQGAALLAINQLFQPPIYEKTNSILR